MGDVTTIEWTATRAKDGTMVPGATFNAWIGCTEADDPSGALPHSPECDNCYAKSGSRRLGAQHKLQLWPAELGGPSDRFFTGETYWKKPKSWARKARDLGVRIKVFCSSYSDVFERRDDVKATRERLGQVILDTGDLDWLLLTKRPDLIEQLMPACWKGVLPDNVWTGTTVGAKGSVQRALDLVRSPEAVVKFLSCEPLLDDLADALDPLVCPDCRGLEWSPGEDGTPFCPECESEMVSGVVLDPLNGGIQWAIFGGESGRKARPMAHENVTKLVAKCRQEGVAPFVKQMGRWILGDDAGFKVDNWLLEHDGHNWRGFVPPIIGENAHKRPPGAIGFSLFDKHGGDWNAWPEALRVREYPEPTRLIGAA